MAEELQTLQGTIQRIIYQNPANSFMIASFLPEGEKQTITVKGALIGVSSEDRVQLNGRWENHKTYGKQFNVQECLPILPNTLVGIERYLSSGIFKDIGPKTAERIVKKFGINTFEVIDESPSRLMEVPQFTRKKLKEILKVWDEHKATRNIMRFFYEIGISPTYASKIFEAYGPETIAILKQNPYILTEIRGIGFVKADQIARNLGIPPNSPHRAKAGLLHTLQELTFQGHTCYPVTPLLERTSQQLSIEGALLPLALNELIAEKTLLARQLMLSLNPVGPPQELQCIAPTNLYHAEQRISENLFRLLQQHAYTEFPDAERVIERMEHKLQITLAPAQKEAVLEALRHKVLIITGGPGTGKTTIVQFILSLLRSYIPQISLAAPTGRAAKRLAEATDSNAMTIHRLLGSNGWEFTHTRTNPLESELLIIDESSMIDTYLMDHLLDAIRSEARLILVGDVDQLPSVGPGAILRNLIDSRVIPVARLETIFRQANNSLITQNAHSIRRGLLPKLGRARPGQDFDFIALEEPERIVQSIVDLVTVHLPHQLQVNPMSEIQVLTPMHRGLTGSINLNQQLQAVLNPSPSLLESRGQAFKIGDKVMQQQNSYDKEVFNGDIGIIADADPKTKEILVRFDQVSAIYKPEEIEQLALAYAISVHKSQGSEYPIVVLPLTTQHYMMLQRNLLYTALTRGKRLVILIGSEQAVKLAVENASPTLRYTGLKQEIETLWEEVAR